MDFKKIEKIGLELATTRKDLHDQLELLKQTTAKIKDLRQQEKTKITMILHYTTN